MGLPLPRARTHPRPASTRRRLLSPAGAGSGRIGRAAGRESGRRATIVAEVVGAAAVAAVLARGASGLRPVMRRRRLEPPAMRQAARKRRHRGSRLRQVAATNSSIAATIFHVLRDRSPSWFEAAADYEGRGALLPSHLPHDCAPVSPRTTLPRHHASSVPNIIPSVAATSLRMRRACAAFVRIERSEVHISAAQVGRGDGHHLHLRREGREGAGDGRRRGRRGRARLVARSAARSCDRLAG